MDDEPMGSVAQSKEQQSVYIQKSAGSVKGNSATAL
jgi:hypothetical protein